MGGTVLTAGASGAAGMAALERFAREPGWQAIGVSRRPPAVLPPVARHLPLDLLDRDACARALASLGGVVTHIVYAALSESEDDLFGGWRDPAQIARNAAMLENLVDPLIGAGTALRHVSLVHGGKAYGIHVPGLELPIPLRETQPRFDGDNFYFRQEDYLAARRRDAGWQVTVLRPWGLIGAATGGSLSGFLVLAVFAALRREAGLDLPMPLGRGDILQLADAALVADVLVWAAETPAAWGEAFNIANGDLFDIHDAFPIVAEALGMSLGRPRAFDLVAELEALAHLWPGMVARHGLAAPANIRALLGQSLQVANSWVEDVPRDQTLRWGYCSTIKLRRAGFSACADSAEMLRGYVRRYREMRLIP